MIQQSKAKIFLGEERDVQQTTQFRQYSIFNTDSFYNEYKEPIGNLYACNENTLAGNASVKKAINKNSCIILIPVVGDILISDTKGTKSHISAGQIQFMYIPAGNEIELQNPFTDELVSFLLIEIKMAKENMQKLSRTFHFNLDDKKNKLCEIENRPVINGENQVMAIGKFNGREEVKYTMKHSQNSLFVFVLEGVFEVQGRLLHEKDALVLWELHEAELEALSNNAIILLMEIKAN